MTKGDRASEEYTMLTVLLKNIPAVTLAFALTACASTPEIKEDEGEYLWPLPPEKPRIRYVRSIWGEEDIRRPSRLNSLLGEKPSTDLFKPYGVTADRHGRVYVTDTVRRAVFVFDELNAKLIFIGVHDKKLRVPVGVIVDERDMIYVSDTGHDAVFVFDLRDNLIREIGKGLLRNPSGMAIDSTRNRLYVVSTQGHRIEVFSLDGEHLFGFGSRGKAPGSFNFPRDIAVDKMGGLYVVDTGNFRVQHFNSEGKFKSEFGSLGSGPGQFSRPRGVGIDTEGNLYITDAAFNNFQIFNERGKLMLFVGTGGMLGPGEFSLPADVHVDIQDRIYVVDQLNKRVQVFQKLE